MLRVVIAGFVGGVLVFFAGAFNHMVLQLGDRAMHDLPHDAAFRDFVRGQNLDHGIYTFPAHQHLNQADQAAMDELNTIFKAGPNGMLIVGRSGEDMMTGRELGLEFLTNVCFALLAAGVVSRLGPNNGFCARWFTVVVMGLAAWLSLTVSYGVWYRFHLNFVRDELLGTMIECSVAGLVIAAIVRPYCGKCEPDVKAN